MKKYLFFFLAIFYLLGCENKSKLTFEMAQLRSKSCSDCAKIALTIPRALGDTRIANKINTVVDEELIHTLKFEDSIDVNSIEEAIQSFTKSYEDFQQEFEDEFADWEARANGEITYESPLLVSLVLNTYTFTGGAHGYGTTTFLNFDKEKSLELENYELFKDFEGFIDFAETRFRETQGISKNVAINSTGFMFSEDTFHLPENLGFTKNGIQLVYNEYEVASYADGPIEITIPFKEATPFLKYTLEE